RVVAGTTIPTGAASRWAALFVARPATLASAFRLRSTCPLAGSTAPAAAAVPRPWCWCRTGHAGRRSPRVVQPGASGRWGGGWSGLAQELVGLCQAHWRQIIASHPLVLRRLVPVDLYHQDCRLPHCIQRRGIRREVR